MPAELLPVYVSNAEFDVALELPQVLRGDVSLRDMLAFCQHFRIKGIGSLLLTATPDVLQEELSKSGYAFLHFLRNVPEGEKLTSRAAPFFDAVAAGDLACAREIARHSRTEPHPELEFEEDFQYVWYLMRHFFLDAPPEHCTAILARFEAALEGASDVRLEICAAFQEEDELAFHDALCGFLAEKAALLEEQVAGDALLPEIAATEAHVSVEGLALLRLAELKGFRTEANYALVPSIARQHRRSAFDAATWQQP